LGSVVHIQIVEGRGQDGKLQHPSFFMSRRGQFVLNSNSGLSLGKENEVVILFKLDEKCNSDSLH
jgi:hypothetical protein